MFLLEEASVKTWQLGDPRANCRQSEAYHPLSCPWNYVLLTLPTVGIISEDIALREPCVVETIWMVYITTPLRLLD